MEKTRKPFYKTWWFVLIIVLFILGGIGSTLDKGKQAAKDSTNVASPPEKEETKELSIEEQAKEVITDELGEMNNANKPRIVNLAIGETATGHNIILTLNAKENSSRAKEIMWQETAKIMEPLSNISGTENISIEWLYPLQDKYGNIEDSRIMTLNVSQATNEKINWESFDFTNYPDIADEYFEHPTLSR